jgi:hypothetical protein
VSGFIVLLRHWFSHIFHFKHRGLFPVRRLPLLAAFVP